MSNIIANCILFNGDIFNVALEPVKYFIQIVLWRAGSRIMTVDVASSLSNQMFKS